jgi:hypothetical protein
MPDTFRRSRLGNILHLRDNSFSHSQTLALGGCCLRLHREKSAQLSGLRMQPDAGFLLSPVLDKSISP